jgi:membrane protease YdiL (CAAX protease family)
MNAGLDAPTLLTSSLLTLLQLGVAIAVVVAAISRWQTLRAWLKPGLQLGAAVFVLSVPGMVATVLFVEPGALPLPAGGALTQGMLTLIFRVTMAVMAVGTLVLTFFFTALQVGVGELAVAGEAGGGRRAYPWLLEGRQETGGWREAALFGGAVGLVSTLVFWAAGVQEGPALELVKRLFPKLAALEAPASLMVILPAVLLAAVTEELFFRGLVQGWLTRWLGGTRRAVLLAVGVSSALWALAHWASTSHPGLKVLQIFLIGLGLGALTRRYSVEASIVAHAVLNLVAVTCWLLLWP